MQLPKTETASSSLYNVVEEYTISSSVLSLTETALSRNPGISVSRSNPLSCVQAAGNDSTPSPQPDWKP